MITGSGHAERPQALVDFMTSPISSTSERQAARSSGPSPSSRSVSRWVPMRQGKHLPQDFLGKKGHGLASDIHHVAAVVKGHDAARAEHRTAERGSAGSSRVTY